jgi:hypothetical protein
MPTKKTPASSPARPARAASRTSPGPTMKQLLTRLEALEQEVVSLRAQAASAEDLERLSSAVVTAWDGLALEISDEAVCHDYEQLNHDSDQLCPTPDGVLVGWGFGATLGDYRTFWRRHIFRKPTLTVRSDR